VTYSPQTPQEQLLPPIYTQSHFAPIAGLGFAIEATRLRRTSPRKYNIDLPRPVREVKGIDYNETYAPVSKLTTFRMLLASAAKFGWKVDHMGVVTAFLNPKIDRDNIYMTLPAGIDWIDPRLKLHIEVRFLLDLGFDIRLQLKLLLRFRLRHHFVDAVVVRLVV
jgi:hypothetical protein